MIGAGAGAEGWVRGEQEVRGQWVSRAFILTPGLNSEDGLWELFTMKGQRVCRHCGVHVE